ncbi:MAG: ribonuclease HII [candidate division WWE3 bacterium]|nr:ribonuclease HII [candidate division WWE3 bacterium]
MLYTSFVHYPDFSFERKLWRDGFIRVAGVDEVGRGAWAGPVFAAAVIFPPSVKLGEPLRDSKRIPPTKREKLAEVIKRLALFWAVSSSSVAEIEKEGIGRATELAMAGALDQIPYPVEFVLVDYFRLSFWPAERQNPIKFGDTLSNSIAAASILAKVARDDLMRELGKKYPPYGFEIHKGYGTRMHQQTIREHGLSEIHRASFVPAGLVAAN